jgi:hypothetical protein
MWFFAIWRSSAHSDRENEIRHKLRRVFGSDCGRSVGFWFWVFGFGNLARLLERPCTQKTWLEHCMLLGLPVRYQSTGKSKQKFPAAQPQAGAMDPRQARSFSKDGVLAYLILTQTIAGESHANFPMYFCFGGSPLPVRPWGIGQPGAAGAAGPDYSVFLG